MCTLGVIKFDIETKFTIFRPEAEESAFVGTRSPCASSKTFLAQSEQHYDKSYICRLIACSSTFQSYVIVFIIHLRRRRQIIELTGAVMAGLVPAIHVVQLKKWKRFATILP